MGNTTGWCRPWRRGEYSAQAAEELDSYLLVRFWAHESDICPLHSILPSMHPGERTRYRTPRFYKHCTSCVEKRAESASWAASPCGLRARSLTSQAPSSQGLRAAARATPQQPTGPGDLLLRYCQRTSIISAATVRWAGPWRDGRNQGGALINTAVFVSGHTQESPVTFACKAWLTSVSGGRSLGLKDSARSSGMAATMEERTLYPPSNPRPSLQFDLHSSFWFVKLKLYYIWFYRAGIFIFLIGKIEMKHNSLQRENSKAKKLTYFHIYTQKSPNSITKRKKWILQISRKCPGWPQSLPINAYSFQRLSAQCKRDTSCKDLCSRAGP